MGDYLEKSEALGNAVWMRRDRELGLSREALAKRLGWVRMEGGKPSRSGWSPVTIVRIERGQRGLLSGAEVSTLARALDLSPDDLMVRISQVRALPEPGAPDDLPNAIAGVDHPEHRATLERIAADLARLARALERGPGEPPARLFDTRRRRRRAGDE